MKKLGKFVSNHPWWTLLGLLVITLFLGYFMKNIRVETRMEAGLPSHYPEVQAYNRMKELFPSRDVVFIGIESDSIYSLRTLQKIWDLSDTLESLKGVKKVLSFATASKIKGTEEGFEVIPLMEDRPSTPEDCRRVAQLVDHDVMYEGMLIGKSGHSTAILVILKDSLSQDEVLAIYKRIQKIVKPYEGPEKFYISGKPVVEAMIAEHVTGDIRKLFPISILVAMVVLFFSFRSLRGVFLPVLTVLLASTWVMGLQGLLGIPLSLETSLLPMLLVAIGTAYGIHLIHQFNEEILAGYDRKEAVYNVFIKRGNAVIIAGLTTVAGFISLVTSQIKTIRTFGLMNGIGVFIVLFISIFMVPAFLAILKKPKVKPTQSPESEILKRLGRFTTKRDKLIIAISIILMFVGAIGIPKIKSESNEIKNFPKDSPIRIADEWINREFVGTTPLNIIFEAKGKGAFKNPKNLRIVDEFEQYVKKLPYVGGAMSLTDMIKRLNQGLFADKPEYYKIPDSRELVSQEIFLYSMSGDPSDFDALVNPDYNVLNMTIFIKTSDTGELKKIVAAIDKYKEEKLKGTGIKATVTGLSRLFILMDALVVKGQIASVISAFILVLIITAIVLRSFKAGILSIIPLFVVVILNFGIMGFAGISLTHATAIVASIAIGIGIDYAVHYINRYRIFYPETRDTSVAIERSTATVGKAIIYNALSVTLGFLVLTLSVFIGIKRLGLLVAITMILSAIGALVILPAVVNILKPGFGGESHEG